ncbi:MAG: hypothetical protein ACXADH_11070 [Candidatus Kariarchaeaceae archaeon]|jgi:chromosome segregation ATPase
MDNYELINELKEPSVIFDEDPEDPNNPNVRVEGVGVYRLKDLEKNVREKLEDIGQRGVKAYSYEDWKRVQWMIDHAAMNEMIKTIVLAKKELGGINEAWFPRRKQEISELKGQLERLNKIVKRQEEELRAAYEKIEQLEGQLKPRNPF